MNLKNISILLVDPDEFYRKIFLDILFALGCSTILQAATAAQAHAICQQNRVDLIFVDSDLPDQSANEFIRSIRMNRGSSIRGIPIISCMSMARMDMIRAVRNMGASFVIRKPVSPKTIFDRLAWISHTKRKFWESDSYYGPDRRAHSVGYFKGAPRRSSDASQDDIEGIFEEVGMP